MREPALSPLDDPPAEDEAPDGGTPLKPPAGWPAPPGPAAYRGLPGEIVGRLAPETEADPVAILAQLLVAFGAAVGRHAHFQVEATRHHPNEFVLLVGESSKARKGSSWDHVRRLICAADRTLGERDPDRSELRRGPRLGRARLDRRRPGRSRPAASGT